MTSTGKPSVHEIFTNAVGMAAAFTCAAVALQFVQPMISGFSDIDLMNLADSLRTAPLVFLTSAFVAAGGHLGIACWKAARPQKPDTPNFK